MSSISIPTSQACRVGGATTHVSVYQFGEANGLIAANFTDSIAEQSNIEALPSTRPFTAWFRQNAFNDKVSLRGRRRR